MKKPTEKMKRAAKGIAKRKLKNEAKAKAKLNKAKTQNKVSKPTGSEPSTEMLSHRDVHATLKADQLEINQMRKNRSAAKTDDEREFWQKQIDKLTARRLARPLTRP